MRIVHLSAEFAPIAKAGGLGEVLVGLSRELTRTGHDVEVILPKYDFIKLPNLHLEVPNFQCLQYQNAMWSARVEECQLHLLEARHPAGFFHRGKIYGCVDDVPRFLYFSRAALEYLKLENKPIDILHLHDWHVSLAAPMVREVFKELKVKAIVLSIHNLEYQGKCAVHDLDAIGLKGSDYLKPNKLQDDNALYPDTINLLKGGITYADAIIPVSPTYAQEILTPAYGFGLDSTLRKMRSKISGILNGIDTTLWDPEKDPHLLHHYSLPQGKEANRAQFPFSSMKRPWIGAVTRLVVQKGPELLEETLKTTLDLGGSFLLLGSAPSSEIRERFEKYKDHPQVWLHYHYNETLAHQLYASLDYLIAPSLFEPCGLTQMIAMRYGTVPIVRATGGLKDTVFDCENPKIPAEQRNGFSFSDPTKTALNETLKRAFALFRKEPATFRALIRRGMQSDFSWKKPAKEYLKLYETLKRAADVGPIRVNIVPNREGGIDSRHNSQKQTDLLK